MGLYWLYEVSFIWSCALSLYIQQTTLRGSGILFAISMLVLRNKYVGLLILHLLLLLKLWIIWNIVFSIFITFAKLCPDLNFCVFHLLISLNRDVIRMSMTNVSFLSWLDKSGRPEVFSGVLISRNFIKTKLGCRCFPGNFANFLRTPFLTGHLRWLLLARLFLLTHDPIGLKSWLITHLNFN